MYTLAMVLVFIVGVINFIPIFGITSAEAVQKIYGLGVIDSNLELLLRHRALLFGIIGGFLLVSVFSQKFQIAAFIMALVSMLGYMILYFQVGEVGESLGKVAKIDMIGIVLLVVAWILLSVSQAK